MKGLDLHPEDLLERDRRGALTAGERERLETHLGECAVCRFERAAAEDFRREAEPLDGSIDVQQILSSVLAPGLPRPAAPPPARVARRWLRVGAIAAAGLLVAGVSMAAIGIAVERSESHGRHEAGDGYRPGSDDQSTRARPPARPQAVPSPPAEPSDAPPAAPAEVVAPLAAPQVAAPRAPAAVPIEDSRPAPVTAATLFGRANDARRAGDVQRAMDAYRDLLQAFPASAEAHSSEAFVGRMLLDSGRPGEALGHFDAYLRTGGALREDVMLDRAVALQRIGRSEDEVRAWSSLLAEYPGTVHADRARRRLAELGRP